MASVQPVIDASELQSAAEYSGETDLDMDGFLRSVERRALQMAVMACRDRDEALDLVQDAMMRLVRRYSARPPGEWRPLFFRILHNCIIA